MLVPDYITPYDIKLFEDRVVTSFKNKEILAPVHLDDGNHEQLWSIFNDFNIKKNDWISCTWRSHAKCFLKGVPETQLMEAIKRGRSMSLCFPEHRVLSSAIVGGNIPIALGLALAEKQQRTNNRVFCFIGDMAAESGIFLECLKYAQLHELPLYFVVEDNGKSVCTPTKDTWNRNSSLPVIFHNLLCVNKHHYSFNEDLKTIYYQYTSSYPHSGVGTRITF
jgi:TPP-dependent pyruvate/acetoin dehydrogenase alpha subunit